MSDLIEPLPWDTEFFGIPIGRADLAGADVERLAAIDAQAREMELACLYGSLDPTDDATTRLVQIYGHRLVEGRDRDPADDGCADHHRDHLTELLGVDRDHHPIVQHEQPRNVTLAERIDGEVVAR